MAALDVEGAESSAYALSALALAYAAEGRSEEVLEVRERVGAVTRGTYLDRATADIAAALSQVRRDPDRSADGLAEVIEAADATDDQILQAVARLAAAVGWAATDSAGSSAPGASADRAATEAIGRDAENRLLDLGIEARGWRWLFETIVSAGL
jgi:hypothetical protein